MRNLIPSIIAVSSITCVAHANWFEEMQLGPAWSNTFADTYDGNERVSAVKGLLLDLGDGYRALFDTETMRIVTVYKGGVHWGGTPWTGAHGQVVKAANENGALLNTATVPGWANSEGSFDDPREPIEYTMYTHDRKAIKETGAFGNLPNLEFNGYFRHGEKIVLDYSVNGARVLDHPTVTDGKFVRYLQIEPRDQPLTAIIADDPEAKLTISDGAELKKSDQGLTLEIPASGEIVRVALAEGDSKVEAIALDSAIKGGQGIWTETITTQAEVAEAGDEEAWVVDTLTLPTENPYKANLRFGGFDFIDDNTAALSTWNGDVWTVSGLKDMGELKWKRFASGMFETLGLKVVDGTIYVNGRDGITRLHDLNGDGEADHYESFNRDVTVSPNFHEFAFDLQTDKEGNFYFAKAAPVRPGGRGFDVIVPHHGTITRVSPDGSSSEVVATGLRAPGGLGVGPNGELTTGENEGSWQPCCKINYITVDQRPAFFGTEPARQGLDDVPYSAPLVYLPMDIDNSGGSQMWVPEGVEFGLKSGEMLHLSYGQSTIFRVLPESVDGVMQGAVVPLPAKIRSSAMRARFHEQGDGSLYIVGFRGWQTNAATESAFHRIRYTGEPVPIPGQFHITPKGVRIHFEVALDEELANDPASYSGQRWDYVHGPQYGSGEFSVDNIDEGARKQAESQESKGHKKRDTLNITAAKLLDDGQTVELEIEGHKPSMSIKVNYDLESEDGAILNSSIHGTVRAIPES